MCIRIKPKEMEFLKMSRQLKGLATEDNGEVSDDKSKIKTEN
jgi:hypothetical protein